jgi:hypothetical protein
MSSPTGKSALLAALLAACSSTTPSDSPGPRLAPVELLPAGIRRLTAAEYDRAASDLLQISVRPSLELPPAARHQGFSANADATIDALFSARLHDVTQELAREAVQSRLGELVPCAAEASAECAEEFVDTFASRAFRRPLGAEERSRYRQLFALGEETGGFGAGVELVLGTLLESPSFLYLTALGRVAPAEPDPAQASVVLTEHELAAQLAFALTGGPPDDELLDAAARGSLATASARGEHARRLLGQYSTRFQFRRFVREWFGIASAEASAKDPGTFPEFVGLQSAMNQETNDFVDAVMIQENASLAALLAGGFSIVPAELSDFYGVSPGADGRAEVSSTGRVGLLQQASFLSTFAHEAESAPVLRGVFVLRRLLCRTLPAATDLGIEISFPVLDANATTRERFSAHSSDPVCRGCHVGIDGAGFTFENFDAIGRLRTREAGRPIDARGSLDLESGHVDVQDSVELARTLAVAPEVERCMQRQLLRFFSGQSEAGAEGAFVEAAAGLAESERSSVLGMTLALVESDLFSRRRSE